MKQPKARPSFQSDCASALLDDGWRECRNQFKPWARCFYKLHAASFRCRTNDDKEGITVEISISDQRMEIELKGELQDGTWVCLHNYALPTKVSEVLALIPRLIATWEFANKHDAKQEGAE